MEWLKMQKFKYLDNETLLFWEIREIFNLCHRWHILRSYRSVVKVTFKRVDIFLNFYMKLEVIVWSNIRLFSWRDKIRFFL